MPVTTEAADLVEMAERGQIKDVLLNGPLSFDCAVNRIAGQSKGLGNFPVAGRADILIAPNVASADGIYRAWRSTAMRSSAVCSWVALYRSR